MRRVLLQLRRQSNIATMSDPIASTSKAAASSESSTSSLPDQDNKKKNDSKQSPKAAGKQPEQQRSGKPRGRRDEPPDVRISKALSYILRHGAAKESLTMRPDGFVRVDELVRQHSHFHHANEDIC